MKPSKLGQWRTGVPGPQNVSGYELVIAEASRRAALSACMVSLIATFSIVFLVVIMSVRPSACLLYRLSTHGFQCIQICCSPSPHDKVVYTSQNCSLPEQSTGASNPPPHYGWEINPPHLTRWSKIHLIWAEHGDLILLFSPCLLYTSDAADE